MNPYLDTLMHNPFLFDIHTALPFIPLLLIAPLLAAIALWTVTIKGFALWHAARGGQKWWFIALILINTAGVLELVYLVWFRKDEGAKVAPAPVSAPTPVAPVTPDV